MDNYGFHGYSFQDFGKFDSIWVVVERMSKSAQFIPVRVDYNAQLLAKVYLMEIVRLRASFYHLRPWYIVHIDALGKIA